MRGCKQCACGGCASLGTVGTPTCAVVRLCPRAGPPEIPGRFMIPVGVGGSRLSV